ncbi:MAG: methylmalonyl Co-A mutase-associated GTPase MeaB [Thermodesulfobacteriota bacterium]
MNNNWEELIRQMCQGGTRALSRLITRVENREPGWEVAMKAIYPHTGRARIFGITGSPGAGKSTLTRELSLVLLEKGLSIGIIAVDPSSPFSGGALLGDRLRMQELYEHPRVFIRSMATRGRMGGLCHAARDVTRLMDAFGKDVILIETVGVGQDEIDIVRVADSVMVVCVPGQGDGIQAIKAGIMEIADFFVVNKADRDGAEELAADIAAMLALSTLADGLKPPVIKTSALKKEGIRELAEAILAPRSRNRSMETKNIREEIMSLLEGEVSRRLHRIAAGDERIDRLVEMIAGRERDPYSAVDELLNDLIEQIK